MNCESQIVGLLADDEIQRIDATVEQYLVHTAIIVLDEILSIATAKEEGIVVIASVQRVVPSSTTQGIVPRQPGEEVFAVVTGEDVIERIARAFEVGVPGQLQIFYIGAQRVVQGGNHRVGARVQRFGDHVTSNTNRVGVVAQPTLHDVVADTTIEAVVAAIAGEDIIERIAGAAQVCDPDQLQIFHIVGERVIDGREHLVGALVQSFSDHISGTVHCVGVVTQPAADGVRARATIQRIVAGAAIDAVVTVRTDDDIGAGAASRVH